MINCRGSSLEARAEMILRAVFSALKGREEEIKTRKGAKMGKWIKNCQAELMISPSPSTGS